MKVQVGAAAVLLVIAAVGWSTLERFEAARSSAAIQPLAQRAPQDRGVLADATSSRRAVELASRGAEPPPSEGLTVAVVTSHGDPVPDASIVAWPSAGPCMHVGATDATGRLAADQLRDWSGTLCAYHETAGKAQCSIDPEASDSIVLTLAETGEIRGVLRTSARASAPNDAVVVAMPEDEPWPEGDFAAAPWIRVANEFGPDGSFVIQGLARDATYSLRAFSPGYAMTRAHNSARTDGEPVQLELSALYGVYLCATEPSGRALRTSKEVSFGSGLNGDSTRVLDPSVRSVPDPLRWLAFWGQLAQDDTCRVRLFTAADDRAVVGPIECVLRVPGYEVQSIRIEAPRWIRGSEMIVPVHLVPQADRWSELTVSFIGSTPAASAAGALGASNRIHLQPAAGDALVVRLSEPLGPDARVEVPAGVYSAWFESEGLWRHPAEGAVTLDLREAATFQIPVHDAGRVTVQLEMADGRRHIGRAGFRFWQGDRRRERLLFFASAPYEFPLVRAGEWRFAALLGDEFAPAGHERFRGTVRLSPGEQRVAVLRAP